MSRRSTNKKKRHRLSYLEFQAVVKKRDGKQWKTVTIKIFDNAKLQWYKVKNNELQYKNEIDLLKMTRFCKSAKHHNCIEVFVAAMIGSTKHKFQFDDLNHYVTFMKYLDKFHLLNLKSNNLITDENRDSIESLSQTIMKQENTTVDDLQKARLYMNECPKGSLPKDFQFPGFQSIVRLLRELWYVFKTAPSMTALKIKSAIKVAGQIREDCLIYVSNYIAVFSAECNQRCFEACLDLIWECIKFESYFESVTNDVDNELLPVSILRSASSLSIQSDSKEKDDNTKMEISVTMKRFEMHVIAAMKSGVHKSITNRLSYLRDESEDKQSFAYTFRDYDRALFGDDAQQKDISITDHLELCCIYCIHNVYKYIEDTKKLHHDVFKATFGEFFNVGNMHIILSDGLMSPVIQFIDDYKSEIKALICNNEHNVICYKQIKMIFDEINEMYDYFLTNCSADSNPLLSVVNMIHSSSSDNLSFYSDINKSIIDYERKNNHINNKTKQHQCWLKLKKMTILSAFNDYFISDFSKYFCIVERAIKDDNFKSIGNDKILPYSTSSTDVIYLIEKQMKLLLRNDLKPIQIVQLAEMITSILMTYITIISELSHQQITNQHIQFEPVRKLSDRKSNENGKNMKKFLNLSYYKRKTSVSRRKISTVLGIKTNIIIKERLLILIGNLVKLRASFNALQFDFDLENKYFQSVNICNGANEIQLALKHSVTNNNNNNNNTKRSPDNVQHIVYRNNLCFSTNTNTMSISIPLSNNNFAVTAMLKSKKFYDAIDGTFEEIAQVLSEKISYLILDVITKSMYSISKNKNIKEHELFEGNPDENTMKSDILENLCSILISCDEIPKELNEFRHYLITSFLSHLFIGIEKRFLLPNLLRNVLGTNEILFLNNLLRDFERLLGDFNILSNESLSNNKFIQYPELTRIHSIIVVYLSNTKQLIQTLKEIIKNNLGFDKGIIDINLLKDNEQQRREQIPYIQANTLLLLLTYRCDIMNDTESAQFMTEYKFITESNINNKSNNNNLLQHLGNIFKKKTDSFKRTLSMTSLASNLLTTPAVSFSLD